MTFLLRYKLFQLPLRCKNKIVTMGNIHCLIGQQYFLYRLQKLTAVIFTAVSFNNKANLLIKTEKMKFYKVREEKILVLVLSKYGHYGDKQLKYLSDIVEH